MLNTRQVELSRRRAIDALAALTLVFFLATSFRFGWTRAASDFPNYYTGARLIREHKPLRKYYDWTWFERQMIFAGYEQIGAYYPLTPMSAFPMIPLADLSPQNAKRAWLVFSLACLGATLWILSLLTRLNISQLWLLTFAGFGALHQNFLFGQYYSFLLLLLTAALACMVRARNGGAGALVGTAFALKLYGGPFILLLLAKRSRKGVIGAAVAVIVFAIAAVAVFGWKDDWYYFSQVLPRSLAGEVLDPYHSLNNTISTFLRRMLTAEPSMNPRPPWNLPWLCFFLQPFIPLCILLVTLAAVHRSADIKRDFAWFCLAVMLITSSAGPYTYILLVLPLALLVEEKGPPWEKVFLIASWIVLGSILSVPVSRFFPKLWVLLAVFFVTGRKHWPLIARKERVIIIAAAATLSTALATLRYTSYQQEPAQHWQRIGVKEGSGFEESPAVLHSGIVCQTIVSGRYGLRWFHQGRADDFTFGGQALSPIALTPDGPVRFELLGHKSSVNMLFDPTTGRSWKDADESAINRSSEIVSPDGNWLVRCRSEHGIDRVWLRTAAGGEEIRLTGGNCASWSPTWDLDSRSVVFVSDCGRGGGWGALYRAHLKGEMARLRRLP